MDFEPYRPIQVSERTRQYLASVYSAAPKLVRGRLLEEWAARFGLTKQALRHRIAPYLEDRND